MILISGEALIDLIPDPVKAGAYDAVLGGSPYNVAIGLARLGAPTAFVSRISADGNGEALASFVGGKRRRSELRRARRAPDNARLRDARHGQNRFALFVLPRRDRLRRPVAFPGRMAEGRAGTCTSARSPPSIPAMGSPSSRALTAARLQRNHQLRSQHPPPRDAGSRRGGAPRRSGKSRSHIWSRRARKTSSGSIPTAASRRASPPGRSPARNFASRRWASAAPSRCLASERIEVPAPRVEVVDTVGAGDSFMSALLSAMDRDQALGAKAPAPSRSELERWLDFAAAASAITCTRKGSDPPTRAEVEAALAA